MIVVRSLARAAKSAARATGPVILTLSVAGPPASAAPTAWQLLDDGDPARGNSVLAYDAVRGVTFRTGPGGDGAPQTWELVGEDWVRQFDPEPTPRGIGGSCATFDQSRGVVVVFGGADSGGGRDETWEYDGSWTQVSTPNRPPGRYQCGLAYDPGTQRVVLFGGYPTGLSGLGDTWEYDGSDWTQVTPATSPWPRGQVAMDYDSTRGVTVLFGGRDGNTLYNDTWEYDGAQKSWQQRVPATAPGRRAGAGMAHDPVRQRTVMFGGLTYAGMVDETWEWNGTTWTQVTTPAAPASRADMALVYDAGRGRVVGQGGGPDNGDYNDTWEYDGTTWTRIAISGLPIVRSNFALAYDPRLDGLVLYGGTTAGPERYVNDTWHYINGQWVEQIGVGSPTADRSFGLTYDEVGDRLVGFSGSLPSSVVSDIHEYRGVTMDWVSLPSCCPDPRQEHGWALARPLGGALMFGGRACCFVGAFFLTNDTWTLDGSTWTEHSPINRPSARWAMGLAYDESDSVAIMYGGSTVDGVSGRQMDTWAYDGQDWTLLSASSPPGPRWHTSMAYDEARDVMVLYGDGLVLEGVTWEFDGSQWSAQSTPFQPDPDRCWSPLAYDDKREVVMLFGGRNCVSAVYYNDTWAYGPDPDGDGIVGGLDNCRQTANADQANADGDPAGDLCDCAALDPGSFAPPQEVANVVANGDDLAWEDQSALVGSAVVYDLVSGQLNDLRATGSFSLAQCLAPGLASPMYTDTRTPPAGDGFYYLPRARNACGAGTYGSDRAALDAASPCP